MKNLAGQKCIICSAPFQLNKDGFHQAKHRNNCIHKGVATDITEGLRQLANGQHRRWEEKEDGSWGPVEH